MSTAADRRRVYGPDSSSPPVYAPLDPTASSSKPRPIPRSNLTNEQTPQKTFLKTGLISQANGSAYIEVGNIKIACAVYGPHPSQPPFSPLGTLSLSLKYTPFSTPHRRFPLRDTEPPHLSSLLTEMIKPLIKLELLVKGVVDVYLMVVEGGGGMDGNTREHGEGEDGGLDQVLSAGVTVAATALADAQIPMNALGVGVVSSASTSTSTSTVTVTAVQDKAKEKNGLGNGKVTVGCMPALGMISSAWMVGELEVDELANMIESSLASSIPTHKMMEETLHAGLMERKGQMKI